MFYLKRNKGTIIAQARKHTLERTISGTKWPKRDIDFLKENYGTMNNKELFKKLNRPTNRIVAVANNMKLRKDVKHFHRKETRKQWTTQEENFIIKNYGKIQRRDIAAFLKISMSSLNHKIERLGLSAPFISNLEKDFEFKLKKLGFKYGIQHKIWKYKVDFMINNIIIELNGTYWHCDSRFYKEGPINKMQKYVVDKDFIKYKYLRKRGHIIVIIWEYDFYNNWKEVKSNLLAVLNGNMQDYDSANTGKG